MKLDHPHLYAGLWGTAAGPLQVRLDVPFEAVVGGNANEAGDPVLFAVLVEVRTCKGCIPSEPKLSEPESVALNKRRDKLRDAIG